MMSAMALGGDGRIWRTGVVVALGATLALACAAGATGATRRATRTRAVWAARTGTVRAAHVAAAGATLLATAPDDSTGFSVRPGFMVFEANRPRRTPDYLAGPDLTPQGFEAGRQPPIVWTHWGSRAVGRASYWIGYRTPCRGCRYTLRAVSVVASRVVDGRYTRLSITPSPKGRASTYVLASVRVPASGVSGGVPAYAWCNARDSNVCSPP